MQEMQSRCDQVQMQLEQANSGTKHLLERAEVLGSHKYVTGEVSCQPKHFDQFATLRLPRASTELRAQIADLFISRFTLSQAEIATLSSRDIAVGPDLFTAMDRVVEIRRDCQSLFAYAGSEGLEGDDAVLAGWVIDGFTDDQRPWRRLELIETAVTAPRSWLPPTNSSKQDTPRFTGGASLSSDTSTGTPSWRSPRSSRTQ
jgi:hypothetical protein